MHGQSYSKCIMWSCQINHWSSVGPSTDRVLCRGIMANTDQFSTAQFMATLMSMWRIITARSHVVSITFHIHRRRPVHAFIVQMWWPAVSKCEYWILITVLKLKMHTMSCPQRDLIMTKCDYIKISCITVLQKYVSQTFTTVCTIAFMLKNVNDMGNGIKSLCP